MLLHTLHVGDVQAGLVSGRIRPKHYRIMDGTPVHEAKYERRAWHYLVSLPGRSDARRWLPEHAFAAEELANWADYRAHHLRHRHASLVCED